MGTSGLKQENYDKYRRKRRNSLFLLIFPATIIVVSFLVFYTFNILSTTDTITIFFPLLILDGALIIYIHPRISLYSMYHDYALMVLEDHKPMKTKEKMFTQNWISGLVRDGYNVAEDHQDHLLLYKYSKKLQGLGSSDHTLVFINIAKTESFDFYSDAIDKAMQSVYINNKEIQKVNKQITLQFKKYNHLGEKAKSDAEAAVLYHSGKQRLINLTVAYLEDIQSIYCMCPEKRYPNKYVYFACQEIKRLSNVKE